jgi:CRISPR-associated exonuclease Cas4
MQISEENYLQLSGIQHFAFCRRQWALIHIEQVWEENLRTIEGRLFHERAHDSFFTEKRKDVIISRDMPVFSRTLGISGMCDIVEFHRDDERGVKIARRTGKWRPVPIEYKRGRAKSSNEDKLQLCAQAICLEEMLVCQQIDAAHLYYGETRRRELVELSKELRDTVVAMYLEMRQYYERNYTPRVKMSKSCNACSLKDACLPKLPKQEQSVSAYMSSYLENDTPEDEG